MEFALWAPSAVKVDLILTEDDDPMSVTWDEHVYEQWWKNVYPLVMTNIAMGNGPFIEVYLLNMGMFHGYVK
jgi:hypothetical protein